MPDDAPEHQYAPRSRDHTWSRSGTAPVTSSAPDAAAREPTLRVAHATAGYGRTTVLYDVSLDLRTGEILALVGPNGCGKSSLLKLTLGALQPTSGDVVWFGRPLGDWRRKELARRVAYLPQTPTGLPGQTVADALAAGRAPYWSAFGIESPRDIAAAAEAAELLGLRDWLARPLDTLSGGQRQRAYIARCVAQVLGMDGAANGSAILLDEPDTYLDLRHVAELDDTLRALAHGRGISIVLASHDLNLAAGVADRMALMSDGRVSATGTPAQVLTAGNVAASYGTAVDIIERAGRPIVLPRSRR